MLMISNFYFTGPPRAERPVTTGLPPATIDMPDPCLDGTLHAIAIEEDNTVYAFKGNYYVKIISSGIAPGYPRPIKQDWQNLPEDVDAALILKGKTTYSLFKKGGIPKSIKQQKTSSQQMYIFKGSQVYLYLGKSRELYYGYPRPISDVFPGLPNDLDSAALVLNIHSLGTNRRIFFSKGICETYQGKVVYNLNKAFK